MVWWGVTTLVWTVEHLIDKSKRAYKTCRLQAVYHEAVVWQISARWLVPGRQALLRGAPSMEEEEGSVSRSSGRQAGSHSPVSPVSLCQCTCKHPRPLPAIQQLMGFVALCSVQRGARSQRLCPLARAPLAPRRWHRPARRSAKARSPQQPKVFTDPLCVRLSTERVACASLWKRTAALHCHATLQSKCCASTDMLSLHSSLSGFDCSCWLVQGVATLQLCDARRQA